MKPTKDYIVLNGVEASTTDGDITFQLPYSAFRNFSPNADMTVKLVLATIEYNSGTSAIAPGSLVIRGDLSNRNMYVSSNRMYMASQLYDSSLIAANYILSSSDIQHSAEISCNIFSEITFSIWLGVNQLTLSGLEVDDATFVLEVNYNHNE